MAKVGLVAVMDFSNVADDEFHDWYDLEHLPERQRVPGFLTCERWVGAANPKYSVGAYDLESHDVLKSDAYLAFAYENASPRTKRVTGMCKRLMRVESDQVRPGDELAPAGAGGLLLNAFNVATEHEAEFNTWLDAEHLPALAALPGTLSARRFISQEGSHRHVVLYHLASPELAESTEWKRAARTPWTEKLLPHFRDRLRVLCRRYVRVK